MKRDYITEILSKKERAKHNEREHILYHRTNALASVVDLCKRIVNFPNDPLKVGINSTQLKESGELHKYIPIGMIACVESFFRAALKEMIDLGSPYSERSSKLREIKFDFTMVQAIQGKKLTVGDFLSHLVPMKSFDDIGDVISVLTEKDFFKELKPYFFENMAWEARNKFLSLNELTKENQQEVGKIYESVQEMYKFRNIFCHEAAESDFVNFSAIYEGYDNTLRFLEACNEFIWNIIDPNRPTCNAEWGARNNAELEVYNSELQELLTKLADPHDPFGMELLEIQKVWEDYRNTRLKIIEERWEGGSGQGIAVTSEAIHLTKKRIEELKEIEADIKS